MGRPANAPSIRLTRWNARCPAASLPLAAGQALPGGTGRPRLLEALRPAEGRKVAELTGVHLMVMYDRVAPKRPGAGTTP